MPATVVIEEIVHLLEELFDFRKHKLQIARPVVLSENKNHGDFRRAWSGRARRCRRRRARFERPSAVRAAFHF